MTEPEKVETFVRIAVVLNSKDSLQSVRRLSDNFITAKGNLETNFPYYSSAKPTIHIVTGNINIHCHLQHTQQMLCHGIKACWAVTRKTVDHQIIRRR